MCISILYLQLPGVAHPEFSNIPIYDPHHPKESGSSVEKKMLLLIWLVNLKQMQK